MPDGTAWPDGLGVRGGVHVERVRTLGPATVVDLAAEGVDELAVEVVVTLRRAGVEVPTGATVTYARALALAGSSPVGAYWAGRATLVRRPEDVPAYDQVFGHVFGGMRLAEVVAVPRPVEVQLEVEADEPAAPDDAATEPPDADVQTVRYSATEVLRHRDLATCTADELAQAHRLMADLRVRAAQRPSRRRRPAAGSGGALDLRRTVRRSLRTGGEVLRPARDEPGERPRRLVLLVDVSGSMEPYARALARFAHASVAARRRGQVEVFALGTRVTRITRELATHDPDLALRRAAGAVSDWSGGTRLGDGMRRFNDRWGVRGLARGAVVVVLSDGWDRGDTSVLGDEMARLRRVAHRVVWVNPLKASPGYAPLAGGMAAALPHVDEFVEGHSIASLEALADVVAR
ncbi:MAG TPA: VWA domain-containing protein [Acidimicrobiales bacterium]|nr:VWA domain-containing protein [Acidimicrobiales bacterium]